MSEKEAALIQAVREASTRTWRIGSLTHMRNEDWHAILDAANSADGNYPTAACDHGDPIQEART